MGFFDLFIEKRSISNKEKRKVIIDSIISRMLRFGSINIDTGERETYHIDQLNEFHDYPDVTVFGFPEGSIIVILDMYWYFKLKKNHQTDIIIYKEIEKKLLEVDYPKGIIDTKLEDFVIYRLRLTEPLWNEENITDEELLYSISFISEYCRLYWK